MSTSRLQRGVWMRQRNLKGQSMNSARLSCSSADGTRMVLGALGSLFLIFPGSSLSGDFYNERRAALLKSFHLLVSLYESPPSFQTKLSLFGSCRRENLGAVGPAVGAPSACHSEFHRLNTSERVALFRPVWGAPSCSSGELRCPFVCTQKTTCYSSISALPRAASVRWICV